MVPVLMEYTLEPYINSESQNKHVIIATVFGRFWNSYVFMKALEKASTAAEQLVPTVPRQLTEVDFLENFTDTERLFEMVAADILP